MPKVSVILPVYGVAQFIEKCTQSLLSQTLPEMEFIFVDDHGPDNSIEIVHKLIDNHPRKDQFVILRPEKNLGAGMARNYALSYAKGEYISFVDSDDWVEPTMFEEMYAEACKNNSDLCCCQIQKVYPDGSVGEVIKNPYVGNGDITHDKRKEILSNYVSLFATFIYKRSFIEENEIRFHGDRCADDSFFVSCVWMTAKSIAYVHKNFYKYLIRPGSVCTTKDSSKYQKRLNVFKDLLDYAKKHGIYDEFPEEVDYIYVKKGYMGSVFNYVVNSLEPKPSTISEIYAELIRLVPNYSNNVYYKKNMPLRILTFLIRHLPSLAEKLIRVYVSKKEMMI
ncbi:MAG: glycosyltransferase [Paludibacteraceae bacterium]|jgi:Glycosyltransferases, probably involved in cell wall biogenesis|nr:glycosyltransferase [Paludibacteraceae bacterium]